MKKEKITTKGLVMTGMFTAVLAVLSQIAIPLPSGVPVTMQTFAVALAGCVMGWKMGLAATAVYALVGAIGVPVFSGFTGGLGILFGKTGGFIFGFLFLAAACGIFDWKKNKVKSMICGAIGLAICHLLGILQFQFLTEMGFGEAALLVSVPYLIKDVISVGVAFVVGATVKKTLYAANIMTYAKEA